MNIRAQRCGLVLPGALDEDERGTVDEDERDAVGAHGAVVVLMLPVMQVDMVWPWVGRLLPLEPRK
jgi:hypothetical protein